MSVATVRQATSMSRRAAFADLLERTQLSKAAEAAQREHHRQIIKRQSTAEGSCCLRCQLERATLEPVRFYCELCRAWSGTTDLTTARQRFVASRKDKEMFLK